MVISPASPRSIRQDSLLDGFEADPEKYDARTFYMANKGLVAPMYLFKVSLFLVLIQVFPAVVLSISRAPTRGASGFCEDEPTRYYIVVQLVILASAFSLMAIRLRGIDDGLFIKRELRLTAFAAVMGGLLWVLTQGVWLHETSGTFPTHMLVAVLAYAAVFSISTLWPLWASYQTAPAVQSGEIVTLRKLLAHSEGRQAFLGHLQSEFSVENLGTCANVKWVLVEFDRFHPFLFARSDVLHCVYLACVCAAVFKPGSILGRVRQTAPIFAVLHPHS